MVVLSTKQLFHKLMWIGENQGALKEFLSLPLRIALRLLVFPQARSKWEMNYKP